MRRAVLGATLMAGTASAAPMLQPGQWQTTSRIVSAEMPGAPPAMIDAMKRRTMTHSYCLSARDAEANPRALFEKTDGKCRYTKFSMSGGKMSMAMTCGNATMTSAGTYTASSYQARGTMVNPGPRGTMRMVSNVSGKRVGPCK